MSEIAIVVITYSRVHCLARLLQSLLGANYSDDSVDLVISIDNDGTDGPATVAQKFIWPHGEKKIIRHPNRLGLKNHVLACGELTEEYSAICVFEDDIYASPGFYTFAKQASRHFANDLTVAGISLYAHHWNQYVDRPFCPLDNGVDVYSMQIASSWGQVWSRQAWRGFKEWLNERDHRDVFSDHLPRIVSNWSEKSWLKFHNLYLVEKNKHFIYPRTSFATNFSDDGEHARSNNNYQVPLAEIAKPNYDFGRSEQDLIEYDAFFENKRLAKFIGLNVEDLDVDLYGGRNPRKRYLLSSRLYGNKVIKTFSLSLRPMELNVIFGIEGDGIYLYDMEHKGVKPSRARGISSALRNVSYDIKSSARKDLALLTVSLYLQALKRKAKALENLIKRFLVR